MWSKCLVSGGLTPQITLLRNVSGYIQAWFWFKMSLNALLILKNWYYCIIPSCSEHIMSLHFSLSTNMLFLHLCLMVYTSVMFYRLLHMGLESFVFNFNDSYFIYFCHYYKVTAYFHILSAYCQSTENLLSTHLN